MQLMYVVNLRVEGADAYQRVIGHVAKWLSSNDVPLTATDFNNSGTSELAPARVGGEIFFRHGDWEVIEVPGHRAFKLIVSQAVGTDLELSLDPPIRFGDCTAF